MDLHSRPPERPWVSVLGRTVLTVRMGSLLKKKKKTTSNLNVFTLKDFISYSFHNPMHGNIQVLGCPMRKPGSFHLVLPPFPRTGLLKLSIIDFWDRNSLSLGAGGHPVHYNLAKSLALTNLVDTSNILQQSDMFPTIVKWHLKVKSTYYPPNPFFPTLG